VKLIDFITSPWAIPESRLLEIRELYLSHTRREKLDLRGWEAATGRPTGDSPAPYQVQNGVAVIDVVGVMAKSPSLIQRICGMTSTAQIRQDLQTALQDPTVSSIILNFDSPGGTVDGTQELADAIYAIRGQKPIVSLADGCMCSAAYWAGSAADAIYIVSNTTEVGSIGVVATHVDVSTSENANGRKTTEITAGKYKRIASSYGPLSDEGRATIQAQVDHIYSVFVDEVSKFRGVSSDTVLADMADGRVFLGKQAMDAGLVDGVSTLQTLIGELSSGSSARHSAGAGVAPSTPTISQENPTMNLTELREKHPELAKALVEEGKAEGRVEGAAQELTRVKGCLGASLQGYEQVALEAALDGVTQPGDAALKVVAAQRADLAAAHQRSTSGGVKPMPSIEDPLVTDAADAKRLAEENAAKQSQDPKTRWDADKGLREEFANDFEAFQAFNRAAESGQARILGSK